MTEHDHLGCYDYEMDEMCVLYTTLKINIRRLGKSSKKWIFYGQAERRDASASKKFWDPSQWDKMCFVCQRKEKDQNFNICLRSGPRELTPPPSPPTVSLTVKRPLFFLTTSLMKTAKVAATHPLAGGVTWTPPGTAADNRKHCQRHSKPNQYDDWVKNLSKKKGSCLVNLTSPFR